jgi:NADPH2:quinone reductase
VLALVTTPHRASGIDLTQVDEPDPASNEAVVALRASSINRGELRLMAMRPKGWTPGQDIAGVVTLAASDGSGARVGARVAALVDQGGWAERVAVPTDRLAELPANVSFEAAATLPMAGTTAMRTLGLGGDLCGQTVLVTGASGAVGRFQLQLAHRRGASVTAVASVAHRDELRALGAVDVVVSIESAFGTFALITESVGGASLGQAIERIAPGGTIVVFGSSSGELTSVRFRQFAPGHEGARIQTFMSYASGPGFGADIAALLALVSTGQLDARVALTVPLADVSVALDALRGRTISGKAVLSVTE